MKSTLKRKYKNVADKFPGKFKSESKLFKVNLSAIECDDEDFQIRKTLTVVSEDSMKKNNLIIDETVNPLNF